MNTEDIKFASADLTARELNTVVEILGGPNRARMLILDELTVSVHASFWYEQNGVIYFPVTSDGKKGKTGIVYLKSKSIEVSNGAKKVLLSYDYKPTKGKTFQIAVIKGRSFPDEDRVTSKIRQKAYRCKFGTPSVEIGYLIRKLCSDVEIKKMGLDQIITMHESSNLCLLGTDQGDGKSWLSAHHGGVDGWWRGESGFAFLAPQV